MSARKHWYVVALSRDVVGARPLARRVLGQPLAVFRGKSGHVGCLLDSCPHRGYPLSTGCVTNDQLRCPYHGWEFRADGGCARVPGLDPARPAQGHAAVPVPIVEQDGLVWCWADPESAPVGRPLRLPLFKTPGYGTDHAEMGVFDASLRDLLENFTDTMHPPFVHGSLLNDDAGRRRVEVHVGGIEQDGAVGAEARFIGERVMSTSLFWRLFGGGDGEIDHRERYLAPSIHQFEYRVGQRAHFVSTQLCTPETDRTTRLHMVWHYRIPLPGWLARRPARALLRKLLEQDRRVLATHRQNLDQLADKTIRSTRLDTLGLHMARFLEEIDKGEAPTATLVKASKFEMWL